jgi:hypothetical protein
LSRRSRLGMTTVTASVLVVPDFAYA